MTTFDLDLIARGGCGVYTSDMTVAAAIKRILVVEDDESSQEFYRHFFGSLHAGEFEWTLAGSAEKAQAVLSTARFDAVVLDWRLPRMSGLALLNALRGDLETRDVPVLVVTSCSDFEDRARALASGADGFIVKPFEPEFLRARLGEALSR